MQSLLAFLSKYNHWLLFVFLEVVSMVLLFRFNSYQGSVYFTAANAVSGQVLEWNSGVEKFLYQSKLNEQLTKRNVQLELQNRQLMAMLNKREAPIPKDVVGYKVISAKVVSNSLGKRDNFIVIDKGSADGVRRDMGVTSGTGIVGTVYLTSAHHSLVIPVLNSRSNISVAISKRGYFGYLQWNGGDSRTADVNDVPRHAHFRLYDKVVTSGYSSIFPPGLMVGKVLHVYNSDDGMSYRLKVQLSTDFGRLRDVCVIDNAPMEERINLIRAAQDSLGIQAQ